MNLPQESYAQVNIYQGNKMAQTNPQRGASPQWNQTLLFEVDDFRSALIIVLVDLSQRSDMQEIIRHEFDFNDIVSAMQ